MKKLTPWWITAIACILKGHQWGRSFQFGEQPIYQLCDRCGKERIVGRLS